jgi:4-hydroxy-tetrahydrodipicolinate synthase
VKAWADGNLAEAKALYFKLLPLCKAMFFETNPIPVKTSAALMGLIGDEMRLPMCSMSANLEKLKKVLDYGLI